MTILNKAIDLDKIESDKLELKTKKLNEKERETKRMEVEIKIKQEDFEVRKKQYLYKFYYLNKEKNRKINELSGELKKEKKLFVK
jgi:hypothetical protein